MKKLILTLLALAVLLSLAVPAMAASPVKSYKDAKDGELLYTVNFNGDEAFTPEKISNSCKYFDILPSTDGSSVEFKGNKWHDAEEGKWSGGEPMEAGSIWAGKIAGLDADATTYYTMTYKIWMNQTDGGANTHGGAGCWAGIGGMFRSDNSKWYSFASNYITKTEANRKFSMKLNTGDMKDADGKVYGDVFAADFVPATDADGFMTIRLTYDGANKLMTAYILKSGDGSKEADWLKLQEAPYEVNASGDSMAFAFVSYSSATQCKVKDAKIYKGSIVTANSGSTGDSTTGGTAGGSSSSGDENAKTADSFACIMIAMTVLSAGAVVALTTSRKRFF